jgi:hemoglobin-like flavoprotein
MDAIIKTLKENLGEVWTPQVEDSWQTFLDFITKEMISDNYENSTNLSRKSIKGIQDTWAIAKTLGYFTVGDAVFTNMFEAKPELIELFPFKVYEEPRISKMYIRHVTLVAETLGTAVDMLNDAEALRPILI